MMVWLGWQRRKQAQWHKRAMLAAAILVVMGPGVGRLPIAPPTLGGFVFQLLVGLLLFVPLLLWDRRSLGHIHPATKLALSVGVTRSFPAAADRDQQLGADRQAPAGDLGRRYPARALGRHRLDDLERLVGRQRRALLPQTDVAQMLAGEDDRAFGPEQLGIAGGAVVGVPNWAPIAPTPSDQGARPQATVIALLEQLRPAGVQRLDQFAADPEPLLVAQRGERARIVAAVQPAT